MSILTLLFLVAIGCSQQFDCNFTDTYPKQYITAKLRPGQSIELDGKLDDKAWQEIEFSDNFIDIENEVIPRFDTKMKIRWDDEFIYVGAIMMESQIWANYTEDDMVIAHENDIEVFFDPNGCNCYYKEFEMNALNKTWMLSINKPYNVGGYENSTRVFPDTGWTMMPLLICATDVNGEVNNPKVKNYYWSVEIRFPIDDILVNQTYSHPKNGTLFWRINFSRVQYHVIIINYVYSKIIAENVPEDNWVWSTQNTINMHVPERWGILQFCNDIQCDMEYYDEWSVREMAVGAFKAEYDFLKDTNDPFSGHGTNFTDNWNVLQSYSTIPFDGTCLIKTPEIELLYQENDTNRTNAIGYVITVENNDYIAIVDHDQYLTVISKKNDTRTTAMPDEDKNGFGIFESVAMSVAIFIVFVCVLYIVKKMCANNKMHQQLL